MSVNTLFSAILVDILMTTLRHVQNFFQTSIPGECLSLAFPFALINPIDGWFTIWLAS